MGDNGLLPGTHTFPFSLKLVSNRFSSLPTTYDSHLGKVVYTVEARIVKEKRDVRSQPAIVRVLEVVDINRQDLMQPSFRVMTRNLAYTPFSTSPVTVTCRMPRTGYSIHNDRIDFVVEVNNPKSRRVGSVSVQLFKESTYITGGHPRCFSRVVRGAATTLNPTALDSDSYTMAGCIPVPFTEPTSSNFSVQVGYYLSVVLVVPMTNSGNMVMEFPITIGTVPVQYDPWRKSQPPLDTSPGQHYLTQSPYASGTLPSQAGTAATQPSAPALPPKQQLPDAAASAHTPDIPPQAGASTQPPYAPQVAAASTQPPSAPDMPPQVAVSTQPLYAPDMHPQAAASTQPPYAPDMLPPQSAVSGVPEWTTSPHDWPVTGASLPPPPSYEETVAASNLPVATGKSEKQHEAENTKL